MLLLAAKFQRSSLPSTLASVTHRLRLGCYAFKLGVGECSDRRRRRRRGRSGHSTASRYRHRHRLHRSGWLCCGGGQGYRQGYGHRGGHHVPAAIGEALDRAARGVWTPS